MLTNARHERMTGVFAMPVAVVLGAALLASAAPAQEWEQYETNPFVIRTSRPVPDRADSAGGIFVHDLNGDGRLDYLVTARGYIGAYAHDGTELWTLNTDVRVGGSSEREGLPGHNGPGVQAADTNGDGKAEVVFLTRDGVLHVTAGATGETLWTASPPAPDGAEAWEHPVIANFRGEGDRDILLQATNAEGYRTGRYLAAHALEDLRRGRYDQPLWTHDVFIPCAHNGARVADLNGDGRDEVYGGQVITHTGEVKASVPLRGHVDAVMVADVRPDLPGLEVVALEEGGGNRVFLYGMDGLIWETDYQNWEPQNAAVGNFMPERPGLEIWCRSRFNKHQKPFVFGADGELVSRYEMGDVAPEGWTDSGVEIIFTIDWTGGEKQYAAATERHTTGDVAIFDPITGEFLVRWPEKATRLYVADVSGDRREEVIVLNDNEIRVYHNPEPFEPDGAPRLWQNQAYRRSKMTWNYYSP